MAKMKKMGDAPRLYHGTTESVAKLACVHGLDKYDIGLFDANGCPRSINASTSNGICLTNSYAGLLAFDTSGSKDRWGIIEIDVSHLEPEFFLPYEGFLLEKLKLTSDKDHLKKLSQVRQSIGTHKKKWKESLDSFGICVYNAPIPVSAISRVTIYDPTSNPMMTKAVVGTALGGKFHVASKGRQGMTTKWLLGGDVTAQEWLGDDMFKSLAHAERERISQILRTKYGLDIFHNAPSNSKKMTWSL